MKYVKDRDFAYFPEWRIDIGWKGIKTFSAGHGGWRYNLNLPVQNVFSAVVEVDTHALEAGMLSVDRQDLN